MTYTTTTSTPNNDIDLLLRTRITELLHAQHRSVSWLSRQTGISDKRLHRRLSGQTTFRLGELGTIAMALDVHWADLFPESDELDPHSRG